MIPIYEVISNMIINITFVFAILFIVYKEELYLGYHSNTEAMQVLNFHDSLFSIFNLQKYNSFANYTQ